MKALISEKAATTSQESSLDFTDNIKPYQPGQMATIDTTATTTAKRKITINLKSSKDNLVVDNKNGQFENADEPVDPPQTQPAQTFDDVKQVKVDDQKSQLKGLSSEVESEISGGDGCSDNKETWITQAMEKLNADTELKKCWFYSFFCILFVYKVKSIYLYDD